MPTDRNRIEQWSTAYHILKCYVDFSFKLYFRTTVSDKENIPKDKSLIFAPNHQNALMDALAVLSVKKWQPVFLARADIFKKPLISKILTFFKILPIYRMRDGYKNLQKNDEVFKKTMDVLNNKNGLVILPEGNHGDQKRLRVPLKKGIARIALQAEEASDGKLDLYIVPVGLDYSSYIPVGSKLHIRFGDAIRVKAYLKSYRQNPAKAYKHLLEQVEKGIKTKMISIDDERYYTAYLVMLDAYLSQYLKNNGLPLNHHNQVDAQIHIVDKIKIFKSNLPDDFLLLVADALEYNLLLNRRGLQAKTYPITGKQKGLFIPQVLVLLVTLPIFILSFLNNIFPVAIAKFKSDKFNDKQFVSSIRFTIGLLLFPIFHILQIAAFGILVKCLWLTLAYAVFSPLSVIAFFRWKELASTIWLRTKELYYNTFRAKRMVRVKELNISIKKQLDTIISYQDEGDYMGGPR